MVANNAEKAEMNDDIIYAPIVVATILGLIATLFLTPVGGVIVFFGVLLLLR